MKDLELYKAQYEIEQELANLNQNKEANAFVDNGFLDGLFNKGGPSGYCAQGDSPGKNGGGTYYC